MGSKVKLGAEASAAAEPQGHTAEAATDTAMRAEMLSYSRRRGLFARGDSLAVLGLTDEKRVYDGDLGGQE